MEALLEGGGGDAPDCAGCFPDVAEDLLSLARTGLSSSCPWEVAPPGCLDPPANGSPQGKPPLGTMVPSSYRTLRAQGVACPASESSLPAPLLG